MNEVDARRAPTGRNGAQGDPLWAINDGVLAGLRVLDFGQGAFGPIVAEYLAMLGADVVKVEPLTGDHVRDRKPTKHGTSTLFLGNNLGKKGISLNLKTDEGRRAAERLIGTADVLVENFRSIGVMNRLGLGFDRLRQINPRLVYLHASAFGAGGPLTGMRSYEWVMEALCGFVAGTGEEGGRGEFSRGTAHLDWTGAMINTVAVLLGLVSRDQTGSGMMLLTSQMGATLFSSLTKAMEYFATGETPVPMGGRSRYTVPSGAFPTADGHVIIGVRTDAEWARFCQAADRPEWSTNPRYASCELRRRHRSELERDLESIFVTRTSDSWLDVLRSRAVPCSVAPRRRWQTEVLADEPQTRANDYLVHVETPWGQLVSQAPHWTFERATVAINRPPPALAEHNDAAAPILTGAITSPPPYQLAAVPNEPARSLPLSGLRVLQVGSTVPAAVAGMICRRFGAEVIMTESMADTARFQPPLVAGEGAAYSALSCGKRRFPLDVEGSWDELRRLAISADVVITDRPDAALADARMTFESLTRDAPRLIYGAISGWGERGSRAGQPATELEVQAVAGLNLQVGSLDGPPLFLGSDLVSVSTGVAAVQGVLAALLRRARTDVGDRVSVSMLSVAIALSQMNLAAESSPDEVAGQLLVAYDWPPDHGFSCRDGRVYLDFRNDEDAWLRFFHATACDELVVDPRFDHLAGIQKHRYLLPGLMADRLLDWSYERLEQLVRHDLGATICPVLSLDHAISHPQTELLGLLSQIREGCAPAFRLPVVCEAWEQVVGAPSLEQCPGSGQHPSWRT
jgi:crotonobetainyl-CoA:carnitine CoA-transferase CaiB-like acyl-CoA transferase